MVGGFVRIKTKSKALCEITGDGRKMKKLSCITGRLFPYCTSCLFVWSGEAENISARIASWNTVQLLNCISHKLQLWCTADFCV